MKGRVLLIMPKFHEYPKFINNALLDLGYEVDVFYDFSTDYIYQRYKFSNSLFIKIYLQFFKKRILNFVKSVKYANVLVIRGSGLDKQFYSTLKIIQNNAVFCMYQWDSIKNFDYLNNICVFDKISSFDYIDCINQQHLNIKYIPLFFVQKGQFNFNKKYDVFFVGGVTLERFYLLEKLEKLLIEKKFNFYFYMYISLGQYINLLFKGIVLNPFKIKFLKMSYKMMSGFFNNSKLTIDVAHGHQTGLTMRTFDALGNYCKIITNNSFIKNEEFYNSSNIMLISLQELNFIDSISSFIQEPFVEIPAIDGYSIHEWIRKVLP